MTKGNAINRRRLAPEDTDSTPRFPIVGIGASAGGLDAFTELLKHLPLDTGMAFVLVQHLDPEHVSALPQILSRATALPVHEITGGTAVRPNHVYVIPPDTSLALVRGVLQIEPRPHTRAPHRPVDTFFESLARDQGNQAIGVVLSGTANDGTLGLEAIKAEGGITFAQDHTAKYDSMPRSAVEAGCVDLVLSPADIAAELARIAKHPAHAASQAPRAAAEPEAAESADAGYRKILSLLREHSGVDFSLYRSTTIRRRLTRRLVLTKQDSLEDYARFLRGNDQELEALFSDALIGVTSFFRNPEAFEALKREVFPAVLGRRSVEPVRVWVLGCSTGQEAYSIAIAFAEAAEQVTGMRRLQIFATDVNEKLLDKARHGLYGKGLAEDVSPERLRRFFVAEDGGYRVAKTLREMVIFARQNLINDPPFSRMDLISCRNVLIYLEPALHQQALPTFHYALRPGGFLLLGASESIGGFTHLFAPVDKQHKLYSKKPVPTPALHLPVRRDLGERERLAQAVGTADRSEARSGGGGELSAQREADRVALSQFAPSGVLINDELQILQFRGKTGAYLAPSAGKATLDVLKMAREGLMLPLRNAINKARVENQTARAENVPVRRDGETRPINVQVIPLKNVGQRCYLVVFEDVLEPATLDAPASSRSAPRTDAEQAGRVAALEQELAELREYLQSTQEQQDETHEELQASNEEIQSANEELQSVNEELETSKEELESTNEELTTVNEELSNRNVELNRLNNDLVNLQNSTRLAIVVLDRDLRILRSSPQAERLLGLLATDVGRPISHVRHRLLAASGDGGESALDLEALAAAVISSVREQDREARDEAGHWFSVRVRPYVTLDNRVDGAVVVLVDTTDLKRAEQVIAREREYLQSIVDTGRTAWLVLDRDLRVERANRAFYKIFRVRPEETEQQLIYQLGNGQWDIPRLRELLEQILPERIAIEDFPVEHTFQTIGTRVMLLNARQVQPEGRAERLILLAIEDVTDRRQAEDALLAASRAKDDFLAMLSHELRTPLSALLLQARLLRSTSDDPKTLRATELIERAGTTQARLIDDLLDVSRIVAGKLELERRPLDIAAIVRDGIELLRPLAEKKPVTVVTRVDEARGEVLGDPDRLRQVVWNLVMNAVKYTPAGGRVTVTLDRVNGRARLQVADTGVGIKSDDLPQIFELFFQAARGAGGGGLGLGLALAQKIVEAHAGTITAESRGQDQGSTFTVTLPLLAGTEEAGIPEPPRQEGQATLDGVRILLVEDDVPTREAMHELLEGTGAQVRAAASAADALEQFEEFRPQVLVSDIAMPPGEDGHALIRRLRALGAERGGDVPAIALTALAGQEHRRRALESGYQVHLAKPVDPDDLIAALLTLSHGPRSASPRSEF